MSLLHRIKALSEANSQETIGLRRHLHANPELSYQEYNTAKYVAQHLLLAGIKPIEGIATTGLMAEIKGKSWQENHRPSRRYGRATDS